MIVSEPAAPGPRRGRAKKTEVEKVEPEQPEQEIGESGTCGSLLSLRKAPTDASLLLLSSFRARCDKEGACSQRSSCKGADRCPRGRRRGGRARNYF